ncbi:MULTISPECIES: DUF2861 family protein [unclassified Vibrio]|uniref:DUF2861 family protein n=1 Tax=unclassified Vibrio TaxID=2614977 RepID=UPI0013618AF4|nr:MULTISPECIES: DUF2861 family protein [unclassified Vibrio]NAW56296.1 DUF2861 family protein [Vibrio sp. V36_P2S2PM302]NAX27211.1 DUF2861 family protein [Vibrio sp. V38_P2S17PM301]NAX32679.1 DUF2861 family protein [Vibrio sp. V37_P2S8PM304]
MRGSYWLIGALICAPFQTQAVDWFQKNTPLTQAHQHLLDNDLPSMFSSLVEVWQQETNPSIEPHLNDLIVQSFDVDCGKSLENKPLPDWIKSVLVRRTDIQSPGRDAYRASVEIRTNKELADITLKKWVDKSMSADDEMTISDAGPSANSDEKVYMKRYNLNSRVSMGLYRIDVTAKDQTSWSSWLILGDPKAKYTVRWASKDQWRVEKNALLNKYCPLPKLNVAFYDYVDGSYNQVWSKTYESDYPTSLELVNVPPARYVLAISMTHQRWQGPIIVEQTQIISKTYDVSVEE